MREGRNHVRPATEEARPPAAEVRVCGGEGRRHRPEVRMGKEADGGAPTAIRLTADRPHAVKRRVSFSLAMASRPILMTHEHPSRRRMSPMRIIIITSITALLACGAFTFPLTPPPTSSLPEPWEISSCREMNLNRLQPPTAPTRKAISPVEQACPTGLLDSDGNYS